jgi:ParB family chromosome partitioning protein
MKMEDVPIDEIKLGDRYRVSDGDLLSLARNIQELGLLQPIGIDRRRRLIFGGRRLMACAVHLKWKKIPAVVLNLKSILEGQFSENEFHKSFTPSERAEIGRAVEKELGQRQGRPSAEKVDHGPPFPKGKTRDIAARRAGFESGRQYERVKTVTERGSAELIEAMDEGRVSIRAAAAIASQPKEEQTRIAGLPAEECSEVVKQIRSTRADQEADARRALDVKTFRGLYDAICLIANFPVAPQETWAGLSRVAAYDAGQYLPRAIACLVRLDKAHPNEPLKPELIIRKRGE